MLAQIAELPGVAGTLPAARVVPIRHVDESGLVYDLLVERDERWMLVRWMPECTEPIDGGVDGYLTDLVVDAWEAGADAAALECWAEGIGHPAPARLLGELALERRDTLDALRRWRAAFLASLR